MDRPHPSRGGPPQWPPDARGPQQRSQDQRAQYDNHAPPHDNRGDSYNPGRFPTQRISPEPPGGGYRGPNSGHGNNYQPMPVQSHSGGWGRNGGGTDEWGDSARRRPDNVPKPKRAAKRRMRHDLPGPAGVWFRRQKNAVKAKKVKREGGDVKPSNDSADATVQSNEGGRDNAPSNGNASEQKAADGNDSPAKKEDKKEESLFHDHAADLHECPAWNVMCQHLNRIIPPSHTLFAHKNPFREYRSIMRREVEDNFGLIHEIHEGRYDANHISYELYESDLRVPLLVGYVASVQCHAHSDWTALLVDEMHSVVANTSKNGYCGKGASAGRGVVCWIEERLVKQHPGWVRPGVVWMIEGAKLALFSSKEEDDDDDDVLGNGYRNETGVTGTDISPSTEAARAGTSIDRVVMVGESSLVYAWTPEEAAAAFGNRETNELQSRRNNKIDLDSAVDVVVDEDGDDTETIADVKPNISKLRLVTVDAAAAAVVDLVDKQPTAPVPMQQRPSSKKNVVIDLEADCSTSEAQTLNRSHSDAPKDQIDVAQHGEAEAETEKKSSKEIVDLSALEAGPTTSSLAAPTVTTSPAETTTSIDLTCSEKERTPQPSSTGASHQGAPQNQINSQHNGKDLISREESEKQKPEVAKTSGKPGSQRKDRAKAKAKQKKAPEATDDDPLGLMQFAGKRTPPPVRKTTPEQTANREKENATNRNDAIEKQSKAVNAPAEQPLPSAATKPAGKLPVRESMSAQLEGNDSFDDMLDEDSVFDKIAPNAAGNTPKDDRPSAPKKIGSGVASCLTPKVDKPNAQPKIDTGDSFDDMLDEDEDDALRASISARNNTQQSALGRLCERNAVNKESLTPPPNAPKDTGKSIFDALDDDDDMDFLGDD